LPLRVRSGLDQSRQALALERIRVEAAFLVECRARQAGTSLIVFFSHRGALLLRRARTNAITLAQGPCTAFGSEARPRSCHGSAWIFDRTTRQSLTGERCRSAVLIREGRLSAAAGMATDVKDAAAAEAHTWLGSASRSTAWRGDV
jgi:hypothetical protein